MDEPSSSYYIPLQQRQQGFPSSSICTKQHENAHLPTCSVMPGGTAQNDLELIDLALHRLLREESDDHAGGNPESKVIRNEKDRHLLLRLLDQLESLRAEKAQKDFMVKSKHSYSSSPLNSDPMNEQSEDDIATDEKNTNDKSTGSDTIDEKVVMEELIKEIRTVKKQNRITHWLLGIMLVTTAIWRFSELALALRIRNNISNPFKAFGGFITDRIKGSGPQSQGPRGHRLPHNEAPLLPHMETPQFPHVEMPPIFQIEEKVQRSSTSKPLSGSVAQTEENKSVLDLIFQVSANKS